VIRGPETGVAVEKRLDSATESALCGGILVALLWGIGVSLRVFALGPQEITWAEWMTQLVSGVLAGLIVPPVLVRGTLWAAARIEASRRRTTPVS
jgi:hypothetical protein